MRRQSETLLLVPLLPIFLLGMFPMFLIALLGFFGLALFGVLVVCVGLASSNEAHDHFNHDVIVHGYPRGRPTCISPQSSGCGWRRSARRWSLRRRSAFVTPADLRGAQIPPGKLAGCAFSQDAGKRGSQAAMTLRTGEMCDAQIL